MDISKSSQNLFEEQEREANLYATHCLRIMALITAGCWLLNIVGVFTVEPRFHEHRNAALDPRVAASHLLLSEVGGG